MTKESSKSASALALMQIELEKERDLNAKLRETILAQQSEIQRLKRVGAVDKILNEWHSRNFTSAVADFIIDPNPFEIAASGVKAGSSVTYFITVGNILAIKSEERLKCIYLKKHVKPSSGGIEQRKIYINKNDSNWEKLLFQIQKRGHHLMRASRSFAINIYDYTYTQEGHLILNDEFLKTPEETLHKIKTDAVFDVKLYHERLFEIDRLARTQQEFRLSFEKVQEIERYIKLMNVTKS